jgi:nucleoside-diphosphate-sugar epimerase
VLGGTWFIGRSFCERVLTKGTMDLTLLNRGKTFPKMFPNVRLIRCDRNNSQESKQMLRGKHWDAIVDFTGNEDQQIRNILGNCTCDHYTYISSSTVDLSWPGDPLFLMAQNKLWCETLLQRFVKNVLVVRPGFVCGANDYTDRFEELDGIWCWKGTRNPVHPMIRVELLTNLLVRLVFEERTGIVRAGYNLDSFRSKMLL